MRPVTLWQRLGMGWALRRALSELRALRQGVERQNQLIERLVNHWAPLPPTTTPEEARAASGVSFLDAQEQQAVQDYTDRMEQQTGHTPTEEEILAFLDEHLEGARP